MFKSCIVAVNEVTSIRESIWKENLLAFEYVFI